MPKEKEAVLGIFSICSPIGLNGHHDVFFAQKCIRLVREKLTVSLAYFCMEKISLESTFQWLSKDTVMFEVNVGVCTKFQAQIVRFVHIAARHVARFNRCHDILEVGTYIG